MNSVDSQSAKRKRSPIDDAAPPPPNHLAVSNNVTQINYLVKSRIDKMKLIEGDSETFGDVLALIDDYEGVLQHHESLAANLGAKLTGPLLVKSFEKLFEGPIKILQAPYPAEGSSITWLDVIDSARTKPNSFALSDSASGRVCQFWVKQCRVQISEDDYRLILSGAPERMIPTQPIADDEIAEIGTIDILEQRLAMLIRKADLVAGRARQLNYHLKGRKTAIQSQRAANRLPEPVVSALHSTDTRHSSTPFQAVNHRTPINGENQALHQDLLRQFFTDERKSVPSRNKLGRPVHDSQTMSASPGTPVPHDLNRRMSQPQPTVEELSGGQYRPLMTTKNDKLVRGEPIWPPCDRCRRLRMDCTKYLTACAGCTKKHAKCTWNDITEDEVSYIVGSGASVAESNGIQAGADVNPNLDPGLRASAGGSMDMGSGAERSAYGEPNDGRRNEVEDEHRMLSHMASTAAAVSNQ